MSAFIGAISVSANVILGVALYRRKKRDDEEANFRKQREVALADLLAALRSLFTELNRTTLFDRPEGEIWEFGLSTLNQLRSLCASACTTANLSRFADQSLRDATWGLHDHVKGLQEFQDKWRLFSHSRKGADWLALQREWPDIESATSALRAARPAAEQCKRSLNQFLAKHEPSA